MICSLYGNEIAIDNYLICMSECRWVLKMPCKIFIRVVWNQSHHYIYHRQRLACSLFVVLWHWIRYTQQTYLTNQTEKWARVIKIKQTVLSLLKWQHQWKCSMERATPLWWCNFKIHTKPWFGKLKRAQYLFTMYLVCCIHSNWCAVLHWVIVKIQSDAAAALPFWLALLLFSGGALQR